MRHPEQQYLDLMQDLLENVDRRVDRTGVGTLSLLGAMVRFDISGGQVPILTTKRVYWKTAVKEMLWFLTGGTNIRPLLQDNVRIWSDWPLDRYRKETGEAISQADFEQRVIDDAGFAARWGELGPVYGKQWRRWVGADGREYDQIAELIELLKTNPTSRRMLFHAWNVAAIDQEEIAARTPLRRTGRPDEVAWAILFAASDAASYMTGQTFAIDGGPVLGGILET